MSVYKKDAGALDQPERDHDSIRGIRRPSHVVRADRGRPSRRRHIRRQQGDRAHRCADPARSHQSPLLDLLRRHRQGREGQPYRCEMRAATVLRRSGWTKEMFRAGQRITIQGSPDRIDPNSCYLNTIILEDGSRADRYGQFTKAPAAVAKRALRRPSGEPNISGDWAPEQLVMTDPRGRRRCAGPAQHGRRVQARRRPDRRTPRGRRAAARGATAAPS